MEGNIYGYIRVSTQAQNDDRQWMAMENLGIPRECVFADKQSGKDFDRPAYNQLIARLEQGDTLVVTSLDRLGRNYDELIEQLDIITRKKDVALMVLNLPLPDIRNQYGNNLTGKLISNFVMQIFSYVAQTEREMNIQRTMEGIAAAKARGVRFGRKALAKPADFEKVRRRWEKREISEREASKILGVSRPTFHKWINEDE
ncbi:recombinase family protein [Selenomonas ruminantium]|uniref:Site-specific DNA recombinase n=1 Tax=Selenomonas ruminantium TaxID=971 RepID=A0A1H0UDY3_SELRU|nr:recombinase family protein [Selenomonas ruminantium]SDP64447.1 Site-specific DNA recombinase [Selenomonas ruminantium]